MRTIHLTFDFVTAPSMTENERILSTLSEENSKWAKLLHPPVLMQM